METQLGFTKMTIDEFETWIAAQSVTRTVHMLQEHHTWRPSYAHFTGTNHFAMQDGMRNHHMTKNGWSDIGQHFSIFPDGVIVTGRPLNKSPACILNKNAGAICIENVGDFDVGQDQMTQPQRDAIIRASAAILRRFSAIQRNDTGIVYHHWFASKSCPGSAFFGGNDRGSMNANFLPLVLAALNQNAPSPGTPPNVPGALRYVSVTASALNIRTGPSSSNPKITEHGPAENGTVLRVFDEQNGWLKVSNTNQHWVFGRHTIPAQPGMVTVADSNVRSGPGMQFPVIDVLQPGEPVFVIGSDGDWRQVGPFDWLHVSLIDLI